MLAYVLISVGFGCLASLNTVQSVRCKEGINITVFELPFYHWSERECTGNSRCFSQEISISLGAPVTFRYGGCISTAYSKSFSCEKVFGHDSNLDPSVLLDLLADADDWIDKTAREIEENVAQEMKTFFSKGEGIEEFIEGVCLLHEMMGFNMEKARQLKKPVAKLLTAALDISPDFQEYSQRLRKARLELEQALGKLDTNEPKIAGEIYRFLGYCLGEVEIEAIKSRNITKFAIEKLPGLYKSMLSKYNMSSLIDVVFEMLGAITPTRPEKWANDIIEIFRSSLNISEKSKDYLDPFLDTIPEFVQSISHGRSPGYGLDWIAAIMRGYGVNNTIVSSLGDDMVRFISSISSGQVKPSMNNLIKSLPGLFYRFFPAKKDEIDRAFNAVISGLKSFNLENIALSPLMERTRLSDFITSLIENVQPDLYSRTPGLRMKYERIIINLSKTFYNAMPQKYTDELDTFFSTLESEFAGFPAVNAGNLISELVTNLGGEVPADVKPFLSNMQNIINAMMSSKVDDFYESLMKMVLDYKQAFPDSKFPDIGRRYLENVNRTIALQTAGDQCMGAIDFSQPWETEMVKYEDCRNRHKIKNKLRVLKILKSAYSVETDLYFAIFEAAGLDSDEKIQNISAISKPLATYLQLFRIIDPDDVKEILSDYATWLMNLFDEGDNYKFDNFLFAINATTAKITSKLGKFMKQLRHVHAPKYCKYLSCDGDFCNTHEAMDAVSPISQEALRGEIPKISTTASPTTTSSAANTHSTALTISITMYLAKLFVSAD